MAAACVEADGSYALAHGGTVSATRVPRRSSLKKSKARRLNTSAETGLDAAEILKHLWNYGPNRLPEAAMRGRFIPWYLLGLPFGPG